MNSVITAVFAAETDRAQKPLAFQQVLFTPLLSYAVNSCQNAGLSSVCILSGASEESVRAAIPAKAEVGFLPVEENASLPALLAALKPLANAEPNADFLLMDGNIPAANEGVLIPSYQKHQENGADVTQLAVIYQDQRQSRVNIAWLSAKALLALANAAPKETLEELCAAAGCSFAICGFGEVCPLYPIRTARDRMNVGMLLNAYKMQALLDEGVEILSSDGVLIAPDAKVGEGTVIYPGTILKGGVTIGKDCVIGPNTNLCNTSVEDGAILHAVYANDAVVKHHANIGPWTQLRPNTVIEHHVHLGDFVEIKNATIGAGTSVSHLSYVGDSDVGKNCNFGCGVAVANYDGVHKYRCTIGDGAFIGCNTNLVAPVQIGDNGYTAAGSTITKDVPAEALGIARARQTNIDGFATKKLEGRKLKVQE